jgi:hypothetical protein
LLIRDETATALLWASVGGDRNSKVMIYDLSVVRRPGVQAPGAVIVPDSTNLNVWV